MTETSGRFFVTHVDSNSAILKDVFDGGVYSVEDSSSIEPNQVVECTLKAVPPMLVTWEFQTIQTQWSLDIEYNSTPPATQARSLAKDGSPGELIQEPLEREGELHVLPVPESETDAIVDDIIADEATRVRAARMESNRVEVRSQPGLITIRYQR